MVEGLGGSALLPRCPFAALRAGSAAPPSTWHLLIDELPRPGWTNMAIDHALLERAERQGESWLRLYQWAPHCLSFGRHEPARLRYDAEQISACGIDTVRRPTGGRAVWHAQELTYSVATPYSRFGTLHAAYVEIHQMLADALKMLGVAVSLADRRRTPPLDSGPCFAHPVGGEVMMDGRKVVGSAQLRSGSALLQHGSVLLQDSQYVVRELMKEDRKPAPLPFQQEPWAEAGDVSEAITAVATHRWQGDWDRGADEVALLEEASIHYPHYSSAAWTWSR
jgi:lipoyl(octanoyl) transferase